MTGNLLWTWGLFEFNIKPPDGAVPPEYWRNISFFKIKL